MKATQTNSSKSKDRNNTFKISLSDNKQFSYLTPQNYNYSFEEQNNDLLNQPLKSILENGGRKSFIPEKRSYKDLFISNVNNFPQNINNNITNTLNKGEGNIGSINYSFYNEPSLINKIRRDENMRDNINNMNKSNTDNNIDNIKDSFGFMNKSNLEKKKKEEEEDEDKIDDSKSPEKKFEKQKKIIDEYSVIEKVLKEEQILFLDDKYHISNSREYEELKEESSSYIISKRVNFPNEFYRNDDSEEIDFNGNEKEDNYTIVYPPLNCIVVVKKNKICFFNYINENVYNYADLSKPIKKLLITVPKPDIFISDIKFIMICVMEGEIQFLTLTFKNSDNDFPIIHKTDFIFSFSETVLDLVSTSNHRIFMSTVNNKIYELDYTIKQNNYFNFFGTRTSLEAISKEKPMFFGLFADLKFIFQQSIEIIQKLKVDNTRNILYAIKYTVPKNGKFSLDSIIDSSILIFDLGLDGNDFNKIQEISQEDLCDYGYEYNGYTNFNYLYSERDIKENNYIIEKSNIIMDIEPLTRDKFKDYHLLVIKRNGYKLFLKFNTFLDDSILPNQDKILKFNNSAFCRERITDRFISVLKKIPSKLVNKRNNPILYDMINYFPFSTFCFHQNNTVNINDPNKEYILKVVEDNFSEIAKKENIRFGSQNEGLKETEQILFRTTTSSSTKKLCSVIKLSDYNIEDTCGLGNLLKNSSKNYNMKYIDNNNNGLMDAISYNCMTEYSKQLFYPPEEFALLFNDEFVIYKRLRPIDTLIEIMNFKNINNISEDDNYSDINSNYDNNIISNEINGSNNNIRKNKKSMPFLFGRRNKLNNPFQINRESIILNKFKEFINKHGYIETSVMLLNIITNNNFCYYIKNYIENPNNMANNINIISSFSNNINNNQNNFLRNDLYYLNPYSLIKAKNDNQLMNQSQEFLMKLFTCAKEDIDFQIYKYQNLLQSILQNLNNNKELILQNNNYRYQFNNSNFNNTNMKNSNKFFEGKNFMSYGFILYLSRIIRLFWEENIYIRNKKYYQNDNFEFNIINNMNQTQIMFIKNMLIKFINTINQYKIEFLQQASDITTKSNKLKNYLNDIDKFLNSNGGYIVNEVKKRLTVEEQNILTYHKKNISYFISIFNFEKFNNDLDEIINISKRVIEILNFVDNIYKININRELEKRKSYSILDIKIKDLFRGNYPFVINELLQIIFEVYIKEKNMEFASIKLQEIIQQCPEIVNENDANAIEGNFILKFCKYNQMDNIDKIKYIKEALEKINLNLLSVKIEEVVNYLSKFQDLTNIINLCLKKGKMLKDEVNLNIDHNRRSILDMYNDNKLLFNTNDNDDDEEDNLKSNKKDIKSKQIENNETEFYNCIRIILDILDYLHNSIVFDSLENYIKIKSPNANIFSFPEYIYNLLSNRTPDEYRRMEIHILNLVFNEQYEYIHYNIIDFLKHKNLMNILQEINSPSIEKYLNNEINANNNSVQSLFSMFNFYFRNKNYSCATKILANLVNYTNPSSNFTRNNAMNGSGEINYKNYVTLDDRITYVNTMLRTLDLQIQDAEYIQLPEQKMNEIQEAKSLKEKMVNIRNILKIQQEIKNYLISYLENYNSFNENNDELEEEFKSAIVLLDFEKIDLNNLYNKYAKKFSIFDSCISIFFQLKFSKSNSKIDPKEIRRIYCEYFCKLDDMTLSSQWPNINFERFDRIFNSLIKEKTQYQNFYNMLQNNGMKNKYRDLIPLEFIISIIESMNKKIIFNNDKFIEGDNYLMKLRQDFKQPENPFWLITFLRDQICLPLSFIFNEYYIIYISLSKENMSKFIPNISNNNSDLRSNLMSNNDLSIHTFNTNNISIFNNSNFEEYGMVFDGNLNGDLNRQRSKDAKLYILFLLLGIEKLWINILFDIFDNRIDSSMGDQRHSQNDLDLKQFYLEFKKNGNQKLKNLIKEFYEELKNCKLIYSENKCVELKNYGIQIEENLKNAEDKVNTFYSNKFGKDKVNKNNIDNINNNISNNKNNNSNNIIKTHDIREKLLQVNFVGEDKKNYFGNNIPFSNNYNSDFINLMPYK